MVTHIEPEDVDFALSDLEMALNDDDSYSYGDSPGLTMQKASALGGMNSY